MTKFISYYNLCPVQDPKEFLGIANGPVAATIITTLSRNIVVVIKVSTQKQVRSWSVTEKLSAKVVYDHRSKKYVGVFSNRYLRCWEEHTSDLNNCKKLKFNKSIAELITLGTEQTFVLFTDGSCEELEQALRSRKECNATTTQLDIANANTFSNAKVIALPDERRLLTYFNRINSSDDTELVCRYIQNGDTRRFKLKRGNLEIRVAGYTVIDGNDAPMLLTIWSDKRIFLLSLDDSVTAEKSPGNYVSMITTLKVDSPLSLLGISRNSVAIYGANSDQEGASLLLYNTQFKVIKAKQFFKVYFTFSRLWDSNEHLLLAMGQNLSVVTYRMSREILAELVGTQLNNDFRTDVAEYHINEEESLLECLQYSNASSASTANVLSSRPIVNESLMADGKFVPYENVADFDDTLQELSRAQLYAEVLQAEKSDLMGIQIALMSKGQDSWKSTSEVQILAGHLEHCGASEHEITEKLLPLLIRADLLPDIITCFQRYTNISERILVETLKYVLGKMLTKNGDAPPKEVAAALDTLLACPFDTAAIALYVSKEVSYEQMLLLLDYLYGQLNDDSEDVISSNGGTAHTPGIVFEFQILRWFGVCLTANFQKWTLSRDVQLGAMLYKWHRLFSQYKYEAAEHDQVLAVLYNLVERHKVFKDKNCSKWYDIEEIVLF